jgi:hypothetical protein
MQGVNICKRRKGCYGKDGLRFANLWVVERGASNTKSTFRAEIDDFKEEPNERVHIEQERSAGN